MSCDHPLFALDLGINPENGKRKIKILPIRWDTNLQELEYHYGFKNILALPCGKCFSCKENYRKSWSERCSCEAKLYHNNCFVTLTYDNEHVPNHLVKKHLDVFIRELRRDHKVRYFGCGEYGDESLRPHYHLILFGYMPDDVVPYGKAENGVQMFMSKYLTQLWSKGNVLIEDFHPNNAAYVAGYVGKKLSKDSPFSNWPEFICMSRRPGIGYDYIINHKDSLKDYGFLIGKNGNVLRLGRYASKIVDIDSDIRDSRLDSLRLSENEAMNLLSIRQRELYWKHIGEVKQKNIKRRRSCV